jgi:hypothetical protein
MPLGYGRQVRTRRPFWFYGAAMPGLKTIQHKRFFHGLNPLWWGLWLILAMWVGYRTRFWINIDTIGSLDVARSLRQGDWRQAVNLHWGLVYAAFLAVLPLKDASSWMQIHILNVILLFGAQIFLYLSLSHLKVRTSLATMLCLAWGAANFATGGAIYMTSDATLCLVGSSYIYVLVRAGSLMRIAGWRCAFLLGLLHALAWMTKNIALFGLATIPLLVLLRLAFGAHERGFLEKERLSRFFTFLVAYALPILLVMAVWGAGVKSKYGRWSWGDTGPYTYACFVERSPDVYRAIDEAQRRLPPYGTFWWSDISLSVTDWSQPSYFIFGKQIRRVVENLKLFISHREIGAGAGIIGLIFLGFTGVTVLALGKTDDCFLLLLLSSVSCFVLLMYVSVYLVARFLPFVAMFLLPAGGLWAENIFQANNRTRQVLMALLLTGCLLHGLGIMVYVSLRLAPQGEHFAMAKFIQDRRGPDQDPGPLGAFLYPGANLYHNGVIAYLLRTKTAELSPIKDNLSFSASFIPKIVLLVLAPDDAVPPAVEVNSRPFVMARSWVWGKVYKQNKLILYFPDEEQRK